MCETCDGLWMKAMSLTKSQISTLKRKAADNSLEVEHLLKVACVGDATNIQLLRELSSKHNWSYSGREKGYRVVPFAKWVEAVSVYLDGGVDALVNYACQPGGESWTFALAIFESMRSTVSIDALVKLVDFCLQSLRERKELAQKLIHVFAVITAGKNPPRIAERDRVRLRDFIYTFLRSPADDVWVGTAVVVLERIGNLTSIPLIDSLPPLSYPWEKVAARARRRIRVRCGGI